MINCEFSRPDEYARMQCAAAERCCRVQVRLGHCTSVRIVPDFGFNVGVSGGTSDYLDTWWKEFGNNAVEGWMVLANIN